HCDDGLSSEVLEQRDLLVGEQTYFLTTCRNVADEFPITYQRYSKPGAGTGIDHGLRNGVVNLPGNGHHIWDLKIGFPIHHSLLDWVSAEGPAHQFGYCWRIAMERHNAENFAIIER